jgi:hypothetical protein
MHTGINYYYFNDAKYVSCKWFSKGSSSTFKSRKNKHTMAGAIDRVAISKLH